MVEATPTRLSCSGAAMVKLCTEVLDEHNAAAATLRDVMQQHRDGKHFAREHLVDDLAY